MPPPVLAYATIITSQFAGSVLYFSNSSSTHCQTDASRTVRLPSGSPPRPRFGGSYCLKDETLFTEPSGLPKLPSGALSLSSLAGLLCLLLPSPVELCASPPGTLLSFMRLPCTLACLPTQFLLLPLCCLGRLFFHLSPVTLLQFFIDPHADLS